MGKLIFKSEKTFWDISEPVLWWATSPRMWYFLKCVIRHGGVMSRTNASYLSFLEYSYYFFPARNVSLVFYPYSRIVFEKPALPPSPLSNYPRWMMAWDEVPAFTQPSACGLEEKCWEAPHLTSLCLCSALSRPQAFPQGRSIQGITDIRIHLQGPEWRFQDYEGYRLAVPWPVVVSTA